MNSAVYMEPMKLIKKSGRMSLIVSLKDNASKSVLYALKF